MKKSLELTKVMLLGILMAGVVMVAASSPYFAFYGSKQLWRALNKKLNSRKPLEKDDPRFKNAFYYLMRRGYLKTIQKDGQVCISLTKKGKKRAGKYQIDGLKIEKQKKWDGKYRIIFFDVPQVTRPKRDALRGKLKSLGFY